jgi:hypothetical protein
MYSTNSETAPSDKRIVPIGISDFHTILKNNYIYSDKSLLLYDLFQVNGKNVVIHRPRRFGKTLTLSMVHHFFTAKINNRSTIGLFNNLMINQHYPDFVDKHQGQYPVIFISFKDVKTKDIKSAKEKIAGLISQACKEHYKVLSTSDKLHPADQTMLDTLINRKSTETELEDSLRFLIECLHEHFQKNVIVLIDEYDTPLSAASEIGGEFFKDISVFMANLFSAALKDNDKVEKSLMTGILRIAQSNVLSGLNQLKVYTTLDEEFAQYFGLTEVEVIDLIKSKGLDIGKHLQNVKSWYNGYKIGGYQLYNPWSVLNFLDEKLALKAYWVRTSDDALLKQALFNADIQTKEKLTKLLLGGQVNGTIDEYIDLEKAKKNESALWSLLVAAGYLQASVINDIGNRKNCIFSIPNFEIVQAYISILSQWLEESKLKYNDYINPIFQGDIQACAKGLQNYLSQLNHNSSLSNIMPAQQLYLELMYALLIKLKSTHGYEIIANNVNDKNVCNLFIKVKDRDSAILLEVRYSQAASATIEDANIYLKQMQTVLDTPAIQSALNTSSEILHLMLIVSSETVIGQQILEKRTQEKTIVINEENETLLSPKKLRTVAPIEQQFSEIAIGEKVLSSPNNNRPISIHGQNSPLLFFQSYGKKINCQYHQLGLDALNNLYKQAIETIQDIKTSDTARVDYQEFLTVTLQASINLMNNYISHAKEGVITTFHLNACKTEAQTAITALVAQLKILEGMENVRTSELALMKSVFIELKDIISATFHLFKPSSKVTAKDSELIMAERHVLDVCFTHSMRQIKEVLDKEPESFHPSVFPSYSWSDSANPMIVRKSYQALHQAGINIVIDIEHNPVNTHILTEFVSEINKKDFVVLFVDESLQEKLKYKEGNVVSVEFELIANRYKNDRKSVIVALLSPDKSTIPSLLRDEVFANCHGDEYHAGLFKIILALCRKAPSDKLAKLKDIEKQFLEKRTAILSGSLSHDDLMFYYQNAKNAKQEVDDTTIANIKDILQQDKSSNTRKRPNSPSRP